MEVDFNFTFSDRTMNESGGSFEMVSSLMKESKKPLSHHLAIDPNSQYFDDWVLVSDVFIQSQHGICKAEVAFYHNKSVVIQDYVPSVGDVYYNPDIRALSVWCEENGWNFPEPTEALVKTNPWFWKHFWKTRLIDSRYLDRIYGSRDEEFTVEIEADDM